MNAVEQLKAAIVALRAAAKVEGIEPGSVLGVWMTSQEIAIMAMADTVEWQIGRIEGRLDQVVQLMAAATKRVDAEIGRSKTTMAEWHSAAAYVRSRTAESEESRKVENLRLARELGDGIKETLKTTMLAREIRFNRRQNWSAVALVASVLLACFMAGGVWTGYRSDHGVVGRCLAKQVPDEAGRYFYCRMDIVQGQS